jgi:hypothetical protein
MPFCDNQNSVIAIDAEECIGNSLVTINTNFDVLKNEICSQYENILNNGLEKELLTTRSLNLSTQLNTLPKCTVKFDEEGNIVTSNGISLVSKVFTEILTPTPTPTLTPTFTFTPTPTLTPTSGNTGLFVLGPGTFQNPYYFSENGLQQTNMTSVSSGYRAYFYDNYDGDTLSYTSTVVVVNGTPVANISHTTDRLGDLFGYSISGSTPQAFGNLTGGTVYLTITIVATPTPTRTGTRTPTFTRTPTQTSTPAQTPGIYRVFFTTPFLDINYLVIGSTVSDTFCFLSVSEQTTSYVDVKIRNSSGNLINPDFTSLIIFS